MRWRFRRFQRRKPAQLEDGFLCNPPNSNSNAGPLLIHQTRAHAELVHIHDELPWTQLLAGVSAQALPGDKLPLANTVRAKGMRLGFMADLTDRLDRSHEPPHLRALGRSITEPEIQQFYRAYVLAVAATLQPVYVGLTAETNPVRLQSTPVV